MNRFPRGIALSLLALLVISGNSFAHSGEHAEHAAAKHQEASEVQFADVPLLDQQGHEVNLKQDLVGDKIVVMGFVYTSCTTICPLVSSIMNKVQTQLGDKVGSEVRLVSLTVDPQRDTPDVLQAYSKRYQPGPGWSWVTGTQPAVEATLKGLGTWAADYESHPPLIMVGDGQSDHWTRFYGFTDPQVLVAKIEELRSLRTLKAADVTASAQGIER